MIYTLIKSFATGALVAIGTKWGTTVGGILSAEFEKIWDYIYINAENEFFRDYPNEPRENTVQNIVRRYLICEGLIEYQYD